MANDGKWVIEWISIAMEVPKMDGLVHGKSHRSKWMITRGTPMTQETSIWD